MTRNDLADEARNLLFARRVFRFSALFGAVLLAASLFQPVPHPYHLTWIGFLGLAAVFQGLFWIIGGDPIRYRAIMPIAIFEKISFGFPAILYVLRGHNDVAVLPFALIDLLMGLLFFLAWRRTPNSKPA